MDILNIIPSNVRDIEFFIVCKMYFPLSKRLK